MSEAVDIAEEAGRHKDEWLLFEVIEVDEAGRPVKGRLLHHCKSRDEVDRESMKAPGVHTYAFFTGDLVPPDMIVVL